LCREFHDHTEAVGASKPDPGCAGHNQAFLEPGASERQGADQVASRATQRACGLPDLNHDPAACGGEPSQAAMIDQSTRPPREAASVVMIINDARL
jgi:hypothetical protein